jgi:alkylation response protein AidB-like acyl-CoA dehydrogenase
MVMTALGTATQSWNSVIGALPDTLTGEQQALLDAIQALMEQAKSLGNPIAANGALQQALAQMEALMATL